MELAAWMPDFEMFCPRCLFMAGRPWACFCVSVREWVCGCNCASVTEAVGFLQAVMGMQSVSASSVIRIRGCVCRWISSWRRRWRGAEGKNRPKLTCDCPLCEKVLACLQMWVFQAHPKVTDKEPQPSELSAWTWTRGVGEYSHGSLPFIPQPVLPTLMSRHSHSSFHHLSLSRFPPTFFRFMLLLYRTCLCPSQRGEGVGGVWM